MKMLCLAGVLAATAAAQHLHVYADLSGPWTRIEAGRPSRPFPLPRPLLTAETAYRLERDVQLPAGGLDGLALVMPPLSAGYAVSANGQQIGEWKSRYRFLAPAVKTVVLPIPNGALHPGRNQLAIDAEPVTVVDRLALKLAPSGGPLLGGMTEMRAIAEGRDRAWQLRSMYLPINTVMESMLAVVLIWLSRGSRHRKTLLWVALYMGWVVIGFDLPASFEVFAGVSRTPRAWLSGLNWFIWTAAATEASLAIVEYSPPLLPRILFYALTGLSWALPAFIWFPGAYVVLLINALLLRLAVRRRNADGVGFQCLMVGYNLLSCAIGPPLFLNDFYMIGPVGFHVIPGYRVVIGAALILMVVRRSVRDRNERERLAGELGAASAVQHLLFPDTASGAIEAVYRPAAEVGGDFWQDLPAADGGRILAVGDVSGKGLKAAMIVSLLTGALRNRKSDSPAAILAELNRVAAMTLDGGFVTAAVAHVSPERVTIANAGHPAPYLNGAELDLPPSLPLGVVADAEFAEQQVEACGQLTFISDGVLEAANGRGELYGFERTRAISTGSAGEIAEAARAWGQNDDITVVTVRRAIA